MVTTMKDGDKNISDVRDDVAIAYRTKSMVCVRISLEGEDRIVLIGVTSDSKEPVVVGHFAEKGGEYVFFPSGVGWQEGDVEELLGAMRHFRSGV